jgi:hypothetical protein
MSKISHANYLVKETIEEHRHRYLKWGSPESDEANRAYGAHLRRMSEGRARSAAEAEAKSNLGNN